jgi:hypothetical protein
MSDTNLSKRSLLTNSLLVSGGVLGLASLSNAATTTGAAIKLIDTFAELGSNSANLGDIAQIKGHTIPGLGGGDFIAKSGSVTNDGGTRINCATGGTAGRWERVNYNQLTPYDFGAIGNGVVDDTLSFQKSLNSGKNIYIKEATYIVGTLDIPNVTGLAATVFLGAGMGKTILQAKAANIPIIQKINSNGSADGSVIGDFSIKAHASGSTTPAIKCSGFRDSIFQRIEGLSNGSQGFYSLIDVAAYPWLCYKNEWNGIRLSQTAGWTKMFEFNNGGTNNAANNSNIGIIRSPWAYSNTGMTVIIDARRSAKITIENGIIENNISATAIWPGNTTTVEGTWFELNNIDFDYQNGGDGVPNDGLVVGNYFSNAHNVNFYNTVSGNLWLNNTEPGVQTFINNSYNNQKTKVSGMVSTATPPVISRSSGQTGTLTLNSAGITKPLNHMSGDIVMSISYTWTAAIASTQTLFSIPVPANFIFKSATAAAIRNASGEPTIISFDTAASFWVFNKYNDAHSIVLTLVYTRI